MYQRRKIPHLFLHIRPDGSSQFPKSLWKCRIAAHQVKINEVLARNLSDVQESDTN